MDRRLKLALPRIRIPAIFDERDLAVIQGVVIYAALALVVAIVAGTAVGLFILIVRTISGLGGS